MFGEGCGILVLESADHAERRRAKKRGTIDAIRTIGFLPPGKEAEGARLLMGDCVDVTMVGLSGTTVETPSLMELLPTDAVRIETGPLIGRSLAMGGIAMAALVASLKPHETGQHLAASPEGPYYSIRFRGGDPV